MTPSKQAIKVGFFDRGDTLELTGRWSNDHDWIEVVGGDAGACWVARQFVNELSEPITVINNDYQKIKIRKKPYEKSKVTGYLRRGREIEITQVLLGWGKCKLGWIDLYYVQEED
jgi:SH3-like domain-containing protein